MAESVLIGAMFVLAALEMGAIAERYGRADEAQRYRDAAAQMEATVLEQGWDGEWFLRAYDDHGNRVGSHECDEGQIFVEPQGFCALAGIGLAGRESGTGIGVRRGILGDTSHGIVLQQPPYSQYYVNLGEISSYPPGYKENASVFCHTNPWIMIAEARLGHGDAAHDYYSRINPSARETISDVHRLRALRLRADDRRAGRADPSARQRTLG